ncbi:MAG: histidine--tRNA ligase [Saprospiraceae bacterium]|nr:histidine--tRNA ligase [Saprospiraceae bacterium]
MKPSIPKGTRDFLPHEVARRAYIFNIIQEQFELFGFSPIETPVLENLSTLTGKYGEEGDRLLFKVLNSGDFLRKADIEALENKNSGALTPSIASRGLRYDLTVPFARFVVMHRNELVLPFKRYQIQPVWRADRPQKGRYREFYQCDADAIGSESLLLEAEFITLIDRVFSALGLQVEILLNSRKILSGIAHVVVIADRVMEMTTSVDKLSKIGWSGVHQDLQKRGFTQQQCQEIEAHFRLPVDELGSVLAGDPVGAEGIAELQTVQSYLKQEHLHNALVVDTTLARGLNYYTGCIFEVRATEAQMGSILGGGRYADLTSVFGMPGLSGVGISFGVERIYDIMVELAKFPESLESTLQFLLVGMDEAALEKAFAMASSLRKLGITCSVHPDIQKLKKQLKYAHALNVPNVVLVGLEEDPNLLVWKKMEDGDQQILSFEHFLEEVTR